MEVGTESLWTRWDAAVTKTVYRIFENIGWEGVHYPSPLTKDLPLVRTPTGVVTSILAYLAIVLGTLSLRSLSVNTSKTNGKKTEDPAWLKLFVLLHNMFLVFLSTYMFVGTIYQALRYKYTIWGNLYSPEQPEMARMIYIFYISKIYEFNDTFVMLLKGNIHQITFLHVYHHVSISIVWWFLACYVPSGDPYFTCALNSFVHILMYLYYLLALIIGKDPKKRQKYLWWGKYMTLLQMAQFVLMSFQAVYCYFVEEFPRFLSTFLFLYMQTLLVLFGNFFFQKHIHKSKTKAT